MRIYANQPRFNSRTGKPEGGERVCVEHRSDLTGKRFVEWGDPEDNQPYYSTKFNYGSDDPCFGASGEEFQFGRDNDIEMHVFLSAPYTFTCNEDVTVVQYAHARGLDFATACRELRVEAARKLIDAGRVLPCQLEGYAGDAELPDASKYEDAEDEEDDEEVDEDEDISGWED